MKAVAFVGLSITVALAACVAIVAVIEDMGGDMHKKSSCEVQALVSEQDRSQQICVMTCRNTYHGDSYGYGVDCDTYPPGLKYKPVVP
jgi:hypothetical protein